MIGPKEQWKTRVREVTWEGLKTEALSEGYKLEGYYVNSRSNITVTCPQNHRYSVQAQTWMSGSRCSQCSLAKRTESMRLTERDCKSRLKAEGYSLLSTYKSYQGTISVKCGRGHYWQTTLKNFTLGYRCPTCNALERGSGRN